MFDACWRIFAYTSTAMVALFVTVGVLHVLFVIVPRAITRSRGK